MNDTLLNFTYKSYESIIFLIMQKLVKKEAVKENDGKLQINCRKDFFPFMMILRHPKRAMGSFH